MMTLIDVSNAKIWETDVIQSNIPVVVDFWAEWCGPCKIISPIIDELAKEYEGRVKFAKVNIDEANELASKYNVLSIPTLLIFNNGEVVVQNVGSSTKENYSKIIDKVLKK